jgi:hypothetical protein
MIRYAVQEVIAACVVALTVTARGETAKESNASADGSAAAAKSEAEPRPPLIPSSRKQPRSSSNPPEEVWRPYVEWAIKNPYGLPILISPDLARVFHKTDAFQKWVNWNDWCTGMWKFERDAGLENKPLIPLAADIADILIIPGEAGGEEIRLVEHDLLIKALASSNRSSPAVIDIIDRITSRSELLANMARKATGNIGLFPGFVTAAAKFQDDYPVFTRTENDELLKLFAGFDNASLTVVTQMTLQTTNNTEKQKHLLADERGESTWFCYSPPRYGKD